jgi:LuxR family transcriptional regulator, maltose regulon positive regulatory protein
VASPSGLSCHRAGTCVGSSVPVGKTKSEPLLDGAPWLPDRNHGDAERIFASRVTEWGTDRQPTTTAWGTYHLTRIQRAQGRLDSAAATCHQDLKSRRTLEQNLSPADGPAYVGLAEVAYQHNDLRQAMNYLDSGIALCRQFVHVPPLAAGLLILARIRQANADQAGALDAIDEAERISVGPAGILNPIPAQASKLRLAQGDLPAAKRWIERSGLTADDNPAYPNELGHLVLARVLLAEGREQQVLALLDRLYAAAATQRRTGSLIEVNVVRALALAGAQQHDDALGALGEAPRLACPRGFVRVFSDEGAPMSALLSRFIVARGSKSIAAEIPFDCLARVQLSFSGQPDAGPGRAVRSQA